MNELDLRLEVVSRSCEPLRYILRWISRKPLEIEAWLQRTTNREWHMDYQMVTWPMTSRQLGFLFIVFNRHNGELRAPSFKKCCRTWHWHWVLFLHVHAAGYGNWMSGLTIIKTQIQVHKQELTNNTVVDHMHWKFESLNFVKIACLHEWVIRNIYNAHTV